MTAFLPVIQSADTSPYDSLVSASRPCASAIRRSAFSADKQLCKSVFRGVFAKLGFCADLFDLLQSTASGNFFLHSAKCDSVNNGWVIILDVVLSSFAVIPFGLF